MADHIGIYAISGAFMPNPATRIASSVTPTGVLIGRSVETTSNAAGSIIVNTSIPAPKTLVGYDNEVVSMNAMQSGTLVIESSSVGVVIEIPTYFSKAVRLQHQLIKRLASLADVFQNIPNTSPSASVSGGVSVHDKYIGSMASGSLIQAGTDVPGLIQVVLQDPGDMAAILLACSGNIINVISGTSGEFSTTLAVSVASQYASDTVNIYPMFANDRTSSYTSGAVTIHSWSPLSSSISGVYANSTVYSPMNVFVPVTASGRIRDVRAWVELIHDFRNVSQSLLYGPSGSMWGLQTLQIALRSPNTNFRAAHPLWNAPGAEALSIRNQASLTGVNNRFAGDYTGVPELLRNSYLLWAGHVADDGQADVLGTTTSNYHEFDFDIDMRTVFWDGSNYKNPRDIRFMHPSAVSTKSWDDLANEAVSGTIEYQSPSAFVFKQISLLPNVHFPVTLSGVLTGADTPWMIDNRNDTGNVSGSGAFYNRAVGTVPPDGWLTAFDASVKGWQASWISSSFTTSSIPFLFKSGRLAVRSSKNQVYLFGGEGIYSSVDVSCSDLVAYVPFSIDRTIEQVVIQPTGVLLQNSSMPARRAKMGVAYYTSSVGEHVIVVGGKSSTLDTVGTTGVFFGTFNGVDINWSINAAMDLPAYAPTYDCFVHVVDGFVHMIGGLTSGTFNPDIWSAQIDQTTGMITGTWSRTGLNSLTARVNAATPVANPAGGDFIFIVGYSGSTNIAQVKHLGTGFAVESIINDPLSLTPTGVFRYPLVCSGEHVFAAFNNAGADPFTHAAELSDDGQPFAVHSGAWHHNLLPVPSTSIAESGTAVTFGNVLFAGCGSPTSPNTAQLFASTVIVASPSGDEFSTRGLQVGPSSMQPVYPIMDDVYSLKIFDQTPSALSPNHGVIRGFRPGLRGTECSGTWNLMIGAASLPFDPISGSLVEPSTGVWFRQVRIELVVDRGIESGDFFPSRSRKWLRSSTVPGQDGFQAVGVVSGAGAWDIGLNQTQVSQSSDYGRSVGITANTASSPALIAVQTFITGSLFDYLSRINSGTIVPNPAWFLNGNGFGTPYIPDSLMSLGVTGTAQEIDASASREFYQKTIGQTTIIPNANTMTDYLRRVNYSETTQRVAELAVASPSASFSGF
jgi:hypothetical protein